MDFTITNPYDGGGVWLKGNLHTHTTNSDGARSPQDTVDAYAALHYDFLMISDHDVITDVDRLDPRGMVLIHGAEVTAFGPHILHVNARNPVQPVEDRQTVIDEIRADGGFAIVNHPNWERHFEHCPQEYLEVWDGYTGIEIFNGVVCWQEGNPLATDRWDRLLGMGRRVWGYANDDTHWIENDGVAWNVALCEERSARAIVDALRRGRFYASTGVEILDIAVDGPTIRIRTANAQRIVAYSDFAQRRFAVDGDSVEYRVPRDGAGYVRFECWGPGEAMAWTQPFFLDRAR